MTWYGSNGGDFARVPQANYIASNGNFYMNQG